LSTKTVHPETLERWPNFYIVGAPKAGTTSLYEYLKDIPGIYMSPVKEPNYFSINSNPGKHITKIRSEKKYLNLYKKVKGEKIIGEASTTYLADPDAPILIHQKVPNAQILISLRNPIDRIFSNYLMRFRNGRVDSSFHMELTKTLENFNYNLDTALNRGLYFESVKRYLDIFGPKQVKIIIFEEFIKRSKKTLEEILKFLNLNYELKDFEKTKHNPYTIARGPVEKYLLKNRGKHIFYLVSHVIPPTSRTIFKKKLLVKEQPKPKMDEVDRKILTNFYLKNVEKLQTLLGRSLPWPDFNT